MKTIKVSFPNKTKILLKVEYTDHLSVDIKQCIVNGETIYGYQEQEQSIQLLDNDLFDLINLSGVDNFRSNCHYYAKQCKKYLGETVYTYEDHCNKLQQYKEQLHNHKVFNQLFRVFGDWAVGYIKQYLIETKDLFQYKDFKKSFDYWDSQFSKKGGMQYTPLRKNATYSCRQNLENFFLTLEEYRSLQRKYRFITLPRESEVWDCEKLANYFMCEVTEIYPIMCSPEQASFKSQLDILIDHVVRYRSERLNELLDKYDVI